MRQEGTEWLCLPKLRKCTLGEQKRLHTCLMSAGESLTNIDFVVTNKPF